MQRIKVAIKWKLNDFALWINGVEVATDVSGTVPAAETFDTLLFTSGGASQYFYGKTKCLAVFDEELEDDELEILTGTSYASFELLAAAGSYTVI